MPLDITKPVQTRDGRKVRILATDMKGNYPLVGLVTELSGNEIIHTYDVDGVFVTLRKGSPHDLINVPAKPLKRLVYLNVYKDTVVGYNSEAIAKIYKLSTCLACAVPTEITYNEGEGL